MLEFKSILQAIEAKPTPTRVFFRDDDGGWASERLHALTDCFCELGIPVDIAVIPAAVDAVSKPRLRELLDKDTRLLRFHQHGYAHVNHQVAGRKSEFGDHRSTSQQHKDIVAGRQALLGEFGEALDPIFTPPWNRCSQATVDALARTGIDVISRIVGSATLHTSNLIELPVAIDWQKRRDGRRLGWEDFCSYAAPCFARYDVVGVMLHHGMMGRQELEQLYIVMGGLRESGRVIFGSMMEFARRTLGA